MNLTSPSESPYVPPAVEIVPAPSAVEEQPLPRRRTYAEMRRAMGF